METLAAVFPTLISVVLAGVLIVLFVGMFSMLRGGDFNRRYGNVLMRLRVGLQALAILLIVVFVAFIRAHG